MNFPTGTFPRSNRPHRLLTIQSTETAPGTFGTLVIFLPSDYSGGAIKLTHNQKEKICTAAEPSGFNITYIAW